MHLFQLNCVCLCAFITAHCIPPSLAFFCLECFSFSPVKRLKCWDTWRCFWLCWGEGSVSGTGIVRGMMCSAGHCCSLSLFYLNLTECSAAPSPHSFPPKDVQSANRNIPILVEWSCECRGDVCSLTAQGLLLLFTDCDVGSALMFPPLSFISQLTKLSGRNFLDSLPEVRHRRRDLWDNFYPILPQATS